MAEHDERRTCRRIRTLKGGRIIFNRGYGSADCLIRNLSDRGAMIETAEPVGVPSEFLLYINPERHGRPCRIVWHNGRRMGVTFIAAGDEDAARAVARSMLRAD